jgi:chorismate lyase
MEKLSIFDIAWEANTKKILKGLSPEAQSWILSRDSLTERLKSLRSNFSLRLLNQHALHYQGESFFQRSVLLFIDNHPWIFASSIFPLETLESFPVPLEVLSERPLGEVLFSSPDIHYDTSVYAMFDKDVSLSPYVEDYQLTYHSPIYARKREFQLKNMPFWVSEFFLPPSLEYLSAIKKLP